MIPLRRDQPPPRYQQDAISWPERFKNTELFAANVVAVPFFGNGNFSLQNPLGSLAEAEAPTAKRCASVRMGKTGGGLTVLCVLRRIGSQQSDQHEIIRVCTLPDLDIEVMATCCFHSVQFSDSFAKHRLTTALVLVRASCRNNAVLGR
jgi:hypothetical protein